MTRTTRGERFRYLDAASLGNGGIVGVIPSVTRPFCESCDRVRLTAEGALRNCLFALGETDLRGPMRSGAGDDDLAELTGQPLDDVRPTVDGEHLGAAAGQFQGECGAEPAEADDGDGVFVASQRWSSPRGAGGGGRARGAPVRMPG